MMFCNCNILITRWYHFMDDRRWIFLVRAILTFLSVRIPCGMSLLLLIWLGNFSAHSAGLTTTESKQGLQENLPVLTTIAQIRALSPKEAARKYPIKLQATVTFYNQRQFCDLFIHDLSGGIHVDLRDQKRLVLEIGQIVEVEGISDPGMFVPNIRASRLRVIGNGQLPEPEKISFDQMITGRAACQWVEADGIVSSVRMD